MPVKVGKLKLHHSLSAGAEDKDKNDEKLESLKAGEEVDLETLKQYMPAEELVEAIKAGSIIPVDDDGDEIPLHKIQLEDITALTPEEKRASAAKAVVSGEAKEKPEDKLNPAQQMDRQARERR